MLSTNERQRTNTKTKTRPRNRDRWQMLRDRKRTTRDITRETAFSRVFQTRSRRVPKSRRHPPSRLATSKLRTNAPGRADRDRALRRRRGEDRSRVLRERDPRTRKRKVEGAIGVGVGNGRASRSTRRRPRRARRASRSTRRRPRRSATTSSARPRLRVRVSPVRLRRVLHAAGRRVAFSSRARRRGERRELRLGASREISAPREAAPGARPRVRGSRFATAISERSRHLFSTTGNVAPFSRPNASAT